MKTCILFSGGWDSASCALKMLERGERPDLLFINYGQTYMQNEYAAALRFAMYFNLELYRVQVPLKHDQERRNFYLIGVAKALGYRRIVSGSRNVLPWFDKYRDSNWVALKAFAYLMNVTVELPIVGHSKKRIVRHIRRSYPHLPYNCYANSTDISTCSCVNCTEIKHLI